MSTQKKPKRGNYWSDLLRRVETSARENGNAQLTITVTPACNETIWDVQARVTQYHLKCGISERAVCRSGDPDTLVQPQ